jgi:hypothetical protein
MRELPRTVSDTAIRHLWREPSAIPPRAAPAYHAGLMEPAQTIVADDSGLSCTTFGRPPRRSALQTVAATLRAISGGCARLMRAARDARRRNRRP